MRTSASHHSPTMGISQKKHKRKVAAAEINSTLSVDEAKILLKEKRSRKTLKKHTALSIEIHLQSVEEAHGSEHRDSSSK